LNTSVGHAVSGVVRDARGAPVAQARVWFHSGPAALPDVAALTDAAGRFTLSAPRAGAYEIGCNADARGATRVAVQVGERGAQLEIVLSP
jgi:Carboxypeptidase regulatory-like domain